MHRRACRLLLDKPFGRDDGVGLPVGLPAITKILTARDETFGLKRDTHRQFVLMDHQRECPVDVVQ